MKTKLISMALCALLLTGCTAPVQAEPEPTLRMTVVSASDAFAEMMEAQAGNEILINAADNLEDADGEITLLYMPEAEDVENIAGSGVVMTDDDSILPQNVAAVSIDNDAAVRAAWDALYSYPTHSSPIRLLTLTEGEDGPSREIFQEMLEAGKLQDKGSYIRSINEQTPEEWMTEALGSVAVGLLDTIYAETEELAIAAYDALKAAERNDSVEVICPVMTDKLIELMVEDHWSMGICVGASMKEGAEAMLKLAEVLAGTGEAQSVVLEPMVIYSDDVKALVDSGITDIQDIIGALMG